MKALHRGLLFAFGFFLLISLHVTAHAAGEDFSCYVTDGQGCRINSYYAAQEDAYYLFLTAKEDIGSLTVYLDDSVTAASAGQIDGETHTLTGAFAASGDSVELTSVHGGDT